MSFSEILRKNLKQSALEYISEHEISGERYQIFDSAIIFQTKEDDYSDNPNFHTKSLKAILNNEDWRVRLAKIHSHFKDGTTEMASSNSSDALLMNIFCHPDFFTWSGPKKNLGFADETPEFGWNPELEFETRNTEVDMKLGDNIYEAKLTESDFTEKKIDGLTERYPGIDDIFYLEDLMNGNKVRHYQLLRNIYAAYKKDKSFRLICDARRPELISALYETTCAIKDYDSRKKIGFITWQHIASYTGKDLKEFLKLKYGIEG